MAVKHKMAAISSLALIFTLLSVVSTAPTPVEEGSLNLPLSLNYLGEADGKGYFAEMNRTVNWEEAGGFCKHLGKGLKLASVQTQNQINLLKSALAEYHQYIWLYTSGVEKFMWSETREDIDLSLFDNVIAKDFRELSCIQLYFLEGRFVQMSERECSERASPICST